MGSGMRKKTIQPSQKLLDWWMRFCIRRNKRCFPRQMEYEISSLSPGMDGRKLVQEHYRKKISLCLLILAAGAGISILYLLSGLSESVLYEKQYLEREPAGGEEKIVELDAQIGDITLSGIFIPVDEQKLDEAAAEDLLKEIGEKLPVVILGENEDLTYVNKPLYLPAAWENVPVTIFWESSDPDHIKEDGTLGDEMVPENGKRIILTATLFCGDLSMEKQIELMLYPQELSEEEQLQKKLEQLLLQEQEKSLTDAYFKLPQQLEDVRIVWKEPKEGLLPVLILLVLGATAAVFAGKDQDVHKQYEERNKQLLLEYPEFVSRLQLFICYGMSIRSAFFKMGKEYQKNLQKGGKKKYVSEELLLALRKMENGMNEAEALDFFGRRCHLFCYKKLVSLIQQNLKRGSDGLREALMNETKAAFEERKQTARKLGEEAGTKLLFPMMLMMGIVMVIIMIPAYFSFGGLGS